MRLLGQGTETIGTPALAVLEKTWSGENYWFWARRVLRKLRHGIRRAHIAGEAAAPPGETPSVILVEPQLADNIGMVARAMANFGLDDLRLVAPRDGWPNEKARIAASGANYVIDDAAAYPSLEASMGDLTYVVATTARQRPLKKPVLTPGGGSCCTAGSDFKGRALRNSVRSRAQRPRDRRTGQCRCSHHDSRQLALRVPQFGASGAAFGLRLDARKRHGFSGPRYNL